MKQQVKDKKRSLKGKRHVDISKVNCPGFWSEVRERMWERAFNLFMMDQMKTMGLDTTPTRQEIRESGYLYAAKLMVLREMRGKPKRRGR